MFCFSSSLGNSVLQFADVFSSFALIPLPLTLTNQTRASPTPLPATAGPSSITLRILAINDVYSIDNFALLAAAKKLESNGPTLTIATLAGDFVSPSLLSSIDNGMLFQKHLYIFIFA